MISGLTSLFQPKLPMKKKLTENPQVIKRKKRKRVVIKAHWLIWLAFIMVLLVGGGLFWRLKKTAFWDAQGRLNLALNTRPLTVVSFEPTDQEITFLKIPDLTQIEAVHGYGAYLAESLWQLDELEGYQGRLVTKSLQEFLAVPIDDRLSPAQKGQDLPFQFSEGNQVAASRFFLNTVMNNLQNQLYQKLKLNRWDWFQLWWLARKVRPDKVYLVDLAQSGSLSEVTSPDGVQILEADLVQVGSLSRRLFSDIIISKESIEIGVYNDSQYSGLAKSLAQQINNIGGQVVEAGDWPKTDGPGKTAKCELRCSADLVETYTVKKLVSAFDCRYGGEKMGESRAKVALVVGEAYWRWLTER
jgi:hypothetical protein